MTNTVKRKQPSTCRWKKHYFYFFSSERTVTHQMYDEVIAWLQANVKGKGVAFNRHENHDLYMSFTFSKKKNTKVMWYLEANDGNRQTAEEMNKLCGWPEGIWMNDFMIHFYRRRDADAFQKAFNTDVCGPLKKYTRKERREEERRMASYDDY